MQEARYLYNQAERCFRLAKGAVGPRLADELETLGHDFEREARIIEIVEATISERQQVSELRPASFSIPHIREYGASRDLPVGWQA
jgi:hypothetical protein